MQRYKTPHNSKRHRRFDRIDVYVFIKVVVYADDIGLSSFRITHERNIYHFLGILLWMHHAKV
jgi:hypothetical protein